MFCPCIRHKRDVRKKRRKLFGRNGHVGADRSGAERWHGGHGYGSRNEEGRTILQCAQMYDLAIANTLKK